MPCVPRNDKCVPPLPVFPCGNLRVAIVHPWLFAQGGGEKVVEALAEIFPTAEFFTLMVDRRRLPKWLAGRRIHASFLSAIPFGRRFYQHLSPFYDLATAQFDLDRFDIVVSSGGPAAKTILVRPGTLHVHYCHSPVRYLWDQFATWMKRIPAPLRPLFAASALRQRERDFSAAQRVDLFVANSDHVGRRIAHYYRRDSTTIYPPVDTERPAPPTSRGDYYLTIGRLVPGKRTELLIEACNRLGRRLVVVGTGPEEARLRAMAGPHIEMVGRVEDSRLAGLLGEARAYLFAAEEDFGIATVEAQASGLPVIAFGTGGSREIVSGSGTDENTNGIFFESQDVDAVMAAIIRFEAHESEFDHAAIQRNAQRFSRTNFAIQLIQLVEMELSRKGSHGRIDGF